MMTFVVDGKPFVALAGEVHNSTPSSAAYTERALRRANELGLNTVAVPVTWELVEPAEGTFDFSGVDRLVGQAREHELHLILLWFGAWKNAQCFYAPEWVKRDTRRFRRAEPVRGKRQVRIARYGNAPYSTLSALCAETRDADARAFGQLMAHVRAIDETERTVVAVQVENECGLMTAAREHSAEADELFATERVPEGLVAYLAQHAGGLAPDVREALEAGRPARGGAGEGDAPCGQGGTSGGDAEREPDAVDGRVAVRSRGGSAAEGTWAAVFGPVADELFQAYHTARYVEAVAAAGRAAYDLPLLVNCWLDKGNEPGRYPSGGPVARVMEVWKWAAPSIDLICPDIYVRQFCDVCDAYRKLGNPLGILETATHSYAAPRVVWAIGHHHAPVFSTFGFEEMGEPFGAQQGFLFGMDVNDPALSTPQDPAEYACVMRQLAGLVDAWGAGVCDLGQADAVISERSEEQALVLGGCKARVAFAQGVPGAVLAVPVAWDGSAGVGEAYVLALHATLSLESGEVGRPNLDILALEDGSFEDGAWKRDRRLNGDEAQVLSFDEPALLRVRVLVYE